MTRAAHVVDRQGTDIDKTAARLLNSAARTSYDPDVDVDWNAPLVDGLYFIPPHRVSLYGTELWDSLSEDQRIELSRHELASIASAGIWLEMILMQFLVRYSYKPDPTQRNVHYALTEVADECRHSVMFATMIERIGAPTYGPNRLNKALGTLLRSAGGGPSMFAATLIGEEIPDRLQRECMADERVQPLVRMVNRIHVVEEARHLSFAREELARELDGISRARLEFHRVITAKAAHVLVGSLISPLVYRSIGLDPVETKKLALRNPHHLETLRWAGEKLVKHLDGVGMIGGPSRQWWRAARLV
ncbi:diiron oxygenase [Solihabitans fulvus]|uniref:Diiron oxygenase n=1 Tax=Solihabitans fulvus TaxID=1892852 RepID=A0A5B2XMG1_9PSEU|nr:diiron oxygenase [Solihabitans fulvus]KAA2264091.1 diiron oxygenase [Solihabitans fulvus]